MCEKLKNIHPGEILREEFLDPMGISQYRLMKATGIDKMAISEIVNEKRAISPETALLLSKFFGNSADFWLGLQKSYDLEEAARKEAFQEKMNKVTPLKYPEAA